MNKNCSPVVASRPRGSGLVDGRARPVPVSRAPAALRRVPAARVHPEVHGRPGLGGQVVERGPRVQPVPVAKLAQLLRHLHLDVLHLRIPVRKKQKKKQLGSIHWKLISKF